MTKKILLLALIITLAGCAKKVSFDLRDDYNRVKPVSVLVMPVTVDLDSDEIKPAVLKLARIMAQEKLFEKGYSSIALEDTDAILKERNLLDNEKHPSPRVLGPLFKTDAVLYTHITRWDEDQLASYAALKIGIQFMLYSAKGTLLWKGSFSTKESDFRFDSGATELGIIKAYEPRIQRIEDAIFLTLPRAQKQKDRREFYRWLP